MAARRKPSNGPPIDLARERRVRAELAKLRALHDADPALAERTRQALAGEIDAPDLEDDMANDQQVVLRLPTAMLDRVAKLEALIAADPAVTAEGNTRVTKSVVLRMALARGLDVLEAGRYMKKPKR